MSFAMWVIMTLVLMAVCGLGVLLGERNRATRSLRPEDLEKKHQPIDWVAEQLRYEKLIEDIKENTVQRAGIELEYVKDQREAVTLMEGARSFFRMGSPEYDFLTEAIFHIEQQIRFALTRKVKPEEYDPLRTPHTKPPIEKEWT